MNKLITLISLGLLSTVSFAGERSIECKMSRHNPRCRAAFCGMLKYDLTVNGATVEVFSSWPKGVEEAKRKCLTKLAKLNSAFSSPIEAETPPASAILYKGVLYVTTITDTCNAYSKHADQSAKGFIIVNVNPRTRLGCNSEKATVFEIEVERNQVKTIEDGSTLNINVNGNIIETQSL